MAHKKMYERVVLFLCVQCHGVDMRLDAPKSAVECITTIHLFVDRANYAIRGSCTHQTSSSSSRALVLPTGPK